VTRRCDDTVDTVGTMDSGKNPAQPTGGCGLRIFRNPSQPTTQRPSPQYRKGEASKMCTIFSVDRIFCECIFSSNFYKFIFTCSQNFFEQVYLTNFYKQAYLQKFQSTKGNTHFTRLRFSILQALTLSCGFEGIPENSEPTLTCGLGQSPHCEKKRVNSCVL